MPFLRLLLILFLLPCSAGAEELESDTAPEDPLEFINRPVFSFNKTMDRYLIRPAAQGYRYVLPDFAEHRVGDFFANLYDANATLNSVLQGRLDKAARAGGRFIINSTRGFFGLFDVATENGLAKHHEDFGQTLGVWGFDSGPFIILPLLGPTTLRAATGLGVDGILLNPTTYIDNNAYSAGLMALQYIDFKADLLSTGELLGIAAVDEYGFLRSIYLQYREKLVRDRSDDDPQEDAPDFDSFDD